MNLPKQSPTASLALTLAKNGSSEISVFAGVPADIKQIGISIKKLSVAFPQMSPEFFNLLTERIVKSGMSSKRLEYAVNRVIDTFTYKQLTIADLMAIDVKCRILTYSQMCEEIAKRGASTDEYSTIYIGGSNKPNWVLRIDKERYKLPDRL